MEKSVVFEDTAVSVDLDFKGEKEAVSKHCSVAAHRDPPCTSSGQATTSSQDRLAHRHKNNKDETHQAEMVTLDACSCLGGGGNFISASASRPGLREEEDMERTHERR